MANWRKRFPSTYLQAADLDMPIDATIKAVINELVGTGDRGELKPVLTFRESTVKPVVLNMTRSESVERIAGTPDDEAWGGVRIRLQRGHTKFQGKTVDCIDVVAPPVTPKRAKGKGTTVPEPEPIPAPDFDDEDDFR